MAAVSSKMVELGSRAYDFKLLNTADDKKVDLQTLRGEKATLIMFICNHCPYVVGIASEVSRFAKEYIPKGISVIAISSNDIVNYPEDSPELMKENARENDYIFPYLYDEAQTVAREYGAECTPDFFLYDGGISLVYRGQFDDSRPSDGVIPNGKDLRSACDYLLSGKEINPNQKPSIGCNIKWK
jgi:peroxiredoxin